MVKQTKDGCSEVVVFPNLSSSKAIYVVVGSGTDSKRRK